MKLVPLCLLAIAIFSHFSFAQTSKIRHPISKDKGSYRDIVIKTNLELIKKNPKNLDAHLELGQIFSQKNRHKEAIKHFTTALNISPNSITAIRGIAHSYHRQKDYKNAESYYRKSLKFDSEDDFTFYNLGTLYYDQKKIKEAEEYFKKSINFNPSNISSIFALGEIYKDKKDCANAIKKYSQVLKLKKRALLAYFRTGQCEMEMGKKKKALDSFLKFIEKAERFEPGAWSKQISMAKKYANELHMDVNKK